MELRFTVNGQKQVLEVEPQARLLDVLREQLGLTGAKEGCGEGECGACTVLVDNLAVNSCLVLAHQARGRSVTTVEGLAPSGKLDALQQAFIQKGAIQCGYCTPGMLMSAKALLLRKPKPTEEEIRMALAGNLCRCTGYVNILRAVQDAAGTAESGEVRKA
ncbi:2Fe-2S ferredoxin-type iron-sulfur binding domain protein [Acididesulfobacillus acetoxydans]|uniref:2Fe-2S ferredoxin-type iron-sulfur binding domain protein n=1 Tax=Acididesulfobacillus acetoxydans TaxID=1561005 RepID=A0A8S0W7B9_9FIRM|nr:(2Fe-2S)-binding protein [Acididesulfobacillus acetoxydans]CAA7600559.1 2Fe-2S ferredoxin-type iron-sulfur binding domain protein [Acididesulfobacillus acetoxydans]CEJ06693.1 Nicotinate dehydrogenase small FeS subunit [Acididesulfobacillus acetoxydans]